MKSFKLYVYPAVAMLSLAAAFSAQAESPTPDNTATHVFAQPKSRDQVQAELFQARADGSIKAWSTTYNHMTVAKSLRSRDEVRAEAIAANRADFDTTWMGEDSGSFAMARQQPARLSERMLAASLIRERMRAVRRSVRPIAMR